MQKSIALCLSGKRQWFSNLVKDDEAVNPTGEEGADQDLNFRKAESLLFKEKETHAEGGELLGGVWEKAYKQNKTGATLARPFLPIQLRR